jgi:hypothetical protein
MSGIRQAPAGLCRAACDAITVHDDELLASEAECRAAFGAIKEVATLRRARASAVRLLDPLTESRRSSGWPALYGFALTLHAVMTLRAIRAWDVLSASGYPREADVFARTVMELDQRGGRIASDKTGRSAENWFRRRGTAKDRAAIDGFMGMSFSKALSQTVHGSFAGAQFLLDDEKPTINLGPTEDEAADATAQMMTLCVLLAIARLVDRDADLRPAIAAVVDDVDTLRDIWIELMLEAPRGVSEADLVKLREGLRQL